MIDPLTELHAPETVQRYRDAMRRGDRFPPIGVLAVARRYLVADGHKRLAAYRGLGEATIRVEVWPLGRWLGDQWRQATANARKNRRILRLARTDPVAAARLFGTTLAHWRRVALSLATWFHNR